MENSQQELGIPSGQGNNVVSGFSTHYIYIHVLQQLILKIELHISCTDHSSVELWGKKCKYSYLYLYKEHGWQNQYYKIKS